jgi:hypothetical protein
MSCAEWHVKKFHRSYGGTKNGYEEKSYQEEDEEEDC